MGWFALKVLGQRTFDLKVLTGAEAIEAVGGPMYSYLVGPLNNPEELMMVLEDPRPYGFNICGRGEHCVGG